jgi:hypothetical protein
MAPGTNIGSSTPVAVGGGEIPADLRARESSTTPPPTRAKLAEMHGRSGDWAEQAVRSASASAQEALRQNVVDVVAPDLTTLLEEIDGMTTEPKGLVLNTAGATVDQVEMSLWKRVLDTLIDPNLIVLLMSIGVLGITIEILNPGLILPGTVGVISLIIGLFGLQVLPVSWAGLLLMALAAGFFVAEAFVPSHGALALAGAVSFVVGALMLFDPAGEGRCDLGRPGRWALSSPPSSPRRSSGRGGLRRRQAARRWSVRSASSAASSRRPASSTSTARSGRRTRRASRSPGASTYAWTASAKTSCSGRGSRPSGRPHRRMPLTGRKGAR